MAAPRSKLPAYLAVAAAGGVGYYLYAAGGSPSVAAKKAKEDSHLFSDKPTYGRETGAKLDNAAYEAEKNLTQAKDSAESYAKDRKGEILRGIDKVDEKVEEGASKAKGWFGGK